MQLGTIFHYLVSCNAQSSFHPLPVITKLQGQYLRHWSLGIGIKPHFRTSLLYLFYHFFALSHRSWYILFHAQFVFTDVSFHGGSNTSVVIGETLFKQFSIPRNDCSSFFIYRSDMPVSAWTVLQSGLTPSCQIISQKKGMLVHLNGHFIVTKF